MTLDDLNDIEANSRNPFFRCVEDCFEAVMISDQNGFLRYVNPRWTQLYGYSKEEALGQTARLLRSRHQSESFYSKMWQDILDPKKNCWKGELVNQAKDGTEISVFLTVTPFFNHKNGDRIGYMGIAIDITEKKAMEHELQRQDRLASIGILTSGLAHEIGTPLGVIRGRAEFLKLQNRENHTLRGPLEIIISQVDHISKLIFSLLKFSRKQDHLLLRPIDVNSLLNEVLVLIADKLKKRDVKILVEVPLGTQLIADSNKLQQVFVNLLINSIQAIDAAIQIERRTKNHFISITSIQTNDTIQLKIQDTGIGISPDNMNRVFEPFFTTKDVGSGTGLGLAIVLKILHEMNADIFAESKVHIGTTFTMSFKHPNKKLTR